MHTPTLIVVIIFAFVIILFIKKQNSNISSEEKNQEETDFRDLNEEFFTKSQGENIIPFVRIYAPKDKIILRSILDSEGIPTYVASEHTNNLLPGVRIQGHSDIIIYIIANDQNHARDIVKDYIRNLIESINPDIDVKVGDFFALINALPTSFNQILPEIINE